MLQQFGRRAPHFRKHSAARARLWMAYCRAGPRAIPALTLPVSITSASMRGRVQHPETDSEVILRGVCGPSTSTSSRSTRTGRTSALSGCWQVEGAILLSEYNPTILLARLRVVRKTGHSSSTSCTMVLMRESTCLRQPSRTDQVGVSIDKTQFASASPLKSTEVT